MKMKDVIGNTLLFVGMMAYILLFGGLFGQNNILIGVAAITAMLMMLERDLTIHPVANTVKLTGLNVVTGLAAFAAQFSIWTAVPIHFVMMFIISYTLIFNLKNPLYLPFSLQYLFLLAVPVSAAELPIRLLALAVGAVSIMALQLLVNRKRIAKKGTPIVKKVSASLLKKIDCKLEGESADELDEEIRKSIGSLRSMIYDQREEDYYLTEEGRLQLNVSAALEKINALLDSLEPRHEAGSVIDDVRTLLGRIADEKTEEIDAKALSEAADETLYSYQEKPPQSATLLRLLSNVDYLTESLLALKNLAPEKRKLTRKLVEIPLKFRKLSLGSTPAHTASIKVSYAVRMATGIAFAGFLMAYFNLAEGRWILFTVLSVVIPFYEQSHKKMRDRIFATITGGLLVWILFTVFQTNAIRTGLLLLSGYLMSYVKVYRYSTILVTFSAIGSVALVTGETQFLTVERAVMVLIGVFIGLLVNRFVLPYKLEDAERDLEEMSNDTLASMLSETKESLLSSKAGGSDNVKNLLIISTMIEERARVNLQAAGKEAPDEQFLARRLAASTMYELIEWSELHGAEKELASQAAEVLGRLEHGLENGKDLRQLETDLYTALRNEPDLELKITLSILLELIENFSQIK
ncbi:FUSC family protein [Sporosarcina sp. NCCP-2716]|uniref:FUSC family protein n=1 Tax=Sporosarcina sp. NCCP-2716 TaxID=2943679 RepID=UPI00203A5210|nr:FUSC family protein [Sporosarcina sp. NCCP-2716]GKV70045.1 FUSC family protein [Sporosarcina sp. NCCP-2716]